MYIYCIYTCVYIYMYIYIVSYRHTYTETGGNYRAQGLDWLGFDISQEVRRRVDGMTSLR